MKKLLNKKEISPSCSYCALGKLAPDGETVLCKKKGVVEKDFSCRKFKYDPCKRVPVKAKAMDFSQYSPEDFKL